MRTRHLPRRTFLRGALRGASLALGLPALEGMLNRHGTALAGGRALPRRLGIFFWGNGVRLQQWTPKESGAAWKLTEELTPLAAVKDYVSVVSGMEVLTGHERGHHAGCVGLLSAAPMIPQPHPTSGYASTFSAPSIDQIFADAVGTQTPFRSLEVGVSRRATEGEGTTLQYLSHRGADNPNPPEHDPAVAFDRLFRPEAAPGARRSRGATPAPGGPTALPTALQRALGKSVLDVVAEDVRSLTPKVGKADHARLDQHLSNIRDIERRLERDWKRPAACERARPPEAIAEEDGKEPLAEVNEAMSRIIALALSCDLTRSFSSMFSGSVGGTVFWQVGADKGHHQLTHDEPADQPLVHAATIFTMRQLAVLLETLKETPEGAGNLLDSCALLATSDLAQGREHTIKDYPILVCGRGRGALRYPGVHVRDEGGNTSKVLLTLLRASGLPLKELGKKGGRVTQGLTALEA